MSEIENLLKWANEAWATLDHTQHEYLASELGTAIDDVREALRNKKPRVLQTRVRQTNLFSSKKPERISLQ